MKKDLIKIMTGLLLVLFIVIGLVITYTSLDYKNYAIGEVTSKYRNGDNNKTYHLVISNEDKNGKLEDFIVEQSTYNKIDLNQRVKLNYDIFKQSKGVIVLSSKEEK